MTNNGAKKVIAEKLNSMGLPAYKLTAKTISFMEKLVIKRTFEDFTLADMDRAFFDFGTVTKEELSDYVARWNETPGRLTTAKIGANHVYVLKA
jgi:hypothetical protein